MKKAIDISSVIDLVGYLSTANKRSMQISAVVRVLQEVEKPTMIHTNCSTDVRWYKVGLLFGNINNLKTNDGACVQSISNKVFYGCAVVALPDAWRAYTQDGTQDLVIEGKIELTAAPDTDVVVLQWGMDNNSWYVKPVQVHPIDLTKYTEGMQLLYRRLLKTTMSTLINTLYDVTGIVPCGLGVRKCITTITSKPNVIVYWDTKTDAITLLNETERVNLIDTEVMLLDAKKETIETDLYSNTVIDKENGISVEMGRTYYMRDTFLEKTDFIDKINEKVLQKEQLLEEIKAPTMYVQSDTALRFARNIVKGVKREWSFVTMGLSIPTGFELCTMVLNKAAEIGFFDSLYKYTGAVNKTGSLARLKVQLNLILGEQTIFFKILDYWVKAIEINGTPAIDTNVLYNGLKNNVNEIGTKFLKNFVLLLCEQAHYLLLLFLQTILHLDCNLMYVSDVLATNGKSFWQLLSNPYMMIYYGLRINITDLDTLALVMGAFGREQVQQTRMVAFMHELMCNAEHWCVKGGTLIAYNTLVNKVQYQTAVSGLEAKSIRQYTLQGTLNQRMMAQMYLGVGMIERNFAIPNNYLLTENNKRTYKTCRVSMEQVLSTYIASPLGLVFEFNGMRMVADLQNVKSEIYCYTKCKELSAMSTDIKQISESTLEGYINKFENTLSEEMGVTDVKLESKQKDAVKFVNSTLAAIVGGAGTGKTTIAALILKILQEERNITDDEVLFVAPTGKAAVRLKESVKRPTMTIHRACSIEYTAQVGNVKSNLHKYKAIFIDESSLISLQLMTQLLSAIANGTYVYFFGDIAQSTAIDIGKPFADMLHYIPCVTLKVIKRAATGSLIAKNSDLLMCSKTAPLYTGEQYIVSDMAEATAISYVEALCKYHLYNEHNSMYQYIQGQVDANELMIITPVKNKVYNWGTQRLNEKLQPIFNHVTSETQYVYTKEKDTEHERRFYIGDKVIHLTNCATAPRYRCVDKTTNTFEVIEDKKDFVGIMNGEVGFIKYICDGANITFGNINLTKIESNAIEEQMAEKRKRKIYVFVEYTDVDVTTNKRESFLICYALVKKRGNKELVQNTKGYCVESFADMPVDLAYALTVHKLEGSQAKITICLLFDIKYNTDFLNANLIQTMLTRAREGVYFIGDIQGAFTKARKIDALQLRKTLFDYF